MNSIQFGSSHSTEPEPTVIKPNKDGADSLNTISRRRLAAPTIAAVSVAAAALLLYLLCLSPTVTYTGDCGELIAASYRLGIAHPTGYPLYCLLGRLFALLVPFGEIAWRYNLFSAVSGAATAALVTATVYRLTSDKSQTAPEYSSVASADNLWPAAGAGLLLAGSYYFGSQSVITEVYVTSTLLLCALLYTAIVWHQSIEKDGTPSWRYVYLLGFLFGLALNMHLSCIFLAPGLLLYVVIQHRAHWSPRRGAGVLRHGLITLGCLLLAYSLTLYLPLRAQNFPEPPTAGAGMYWWHPLDWGHPVDFPRWLAHVTGRQYRTLLLTPHEVSIAGHTVRFPWFAQPFSATLSKISTLSEAIALQYLWFTPLLLIGAAKAFRVGRRAGGAWLGAMLLSIVVLNVGVQIHYSVGDYVNFFFPTYLVLAIWMGIGLHWLFAAMSRWGENLTRKTNQPLWSWRFKTLAPLLLIGTIAVQWVLFVPIASFRGNTSARTAGLERAAAAEQLKQQSGKTPSLLLLNDDTLFSFWYVQHVLGRAPATRTPWGPPRRKISAEDRLVELVAKLQNDGPVALAQWDLRTDERFPYTNLTPGGNLWLASRRVLPEPATPTKNNKNAPPGTVTRAAFRRPKIKLQELSAFEVEFTLPNFAASSNSYLKIDTQHKAAHAGWIEVLMVKRGLLTNPPPSQEEVRIKHPTLDRLQAWKQPRRLVVPIGTRAGTHLRAVLPLQPEIESPIGDCDVWVRIVPNQRDRSTPWHRAIPVRLTQK